MSSTQVPSIDILHAGHANHVRRLSAGISLILTLILHAAFMPFAFHAFFAYGTKAVLAAPDQPPPAKEEQRKFQYVLVEEDLPDESVIPSEATARGSRNRLAREEQPNPDLAKGAPSAEQGVRFLPLEQRLPSPAQPSARASKQQTADTPQQKPSTPKPPMPIRDLRKPIEKTTAEDPDTPSPNPETALSRTESRDSRSPSTPPAPQPDNKTAQRKSPEIKDLRARPPVEGGAPQKNVKTSARLAGERSVQILRSRWGEYMDAVARKIRHSWNAETSVARKSYHTGEILLRFGIAKDGTVENIRVAHAPSEMLAEKDMCLRTIRNAAPFPTLTEAMQKDPLLRDIPVIFIFSQ